MANAKTQAQSNLGSIRDYVNYSGYETDRQNAQDVYNTAAMSLQNKYNQLVDTINANRQQLSRDFTSGRATVANDYYANRNLKTGADLSSYLRGTGVGTLDKTLNRMNLGNALSKVANTYYSGQDDINTQLRVAAQDYDINRQTAQNTLNASLANIGAKQKESENDYAKQVATLAEQIQARWDSNANAQASLRAQIEAAEKARNDTFLTNLAQFADGTEEGYKRAIAYYKLMRKGTDGDAYNFLKNYGIYMPSEKALTDNGLPSDTVILPDGEIYKTGASQATGGIQSDGSFGGKSIVPESKIESGSPLDVWNKLKKALGI